jgi:hypothetical protein
MDELRDETQVLFEPHAQKIPLLVCEFIWSPYVLSDQPNYPTWFIFFQSTHEGQGEQAPTLAPSPSWVRHFSGHILPKKC